MKSFPLTLFILVFAAFSIFTYGFVDSNMPISPVATINILRNSLVHWVLFNRVAAAVLYSSFVIILFALYSFILRKKKFPFDPVKSLFALFVTAIFSYSAFSYDVFNYIMTAKVAYTYKENPYVVMPVEISNEPNLAFTRAANKVALYGPTWILFTYIPHIASSGNPWFDLFMFKAAVGAVLGVFLWFVWRETRSVFLFLFFALNPLILVEVLSSGHNDILMMTLAIVGGTLWYTKHTSHKVFGLLLILASVFVKGATVVILPLLVVARTKESFYKFGFWAMLGMFFLTPFREELYPWYAVWFLSFAAFIPPKTARFLHWFCIWFSFGLLLRHAPYIYFGVYEGAAATARLAFTVIVPALYILSVVYSMYRSSSHARS